MADISIRAQWARRLVREELSKELTIHDGRDHFRNMPGFAGGIPRHDPLNLPPDATQANPDVAGTFRVQDAKLGAENWPELKVCIVGAGVAGLYIAMILDSLEIPNLTYDILESSDRVGGRIYTHHFKPTEHQYYDIGAMRFPKIHIMKRTFDLFKLVGVDKKVIKYYMGLDDGAVQCPAYFNDVLYTAQKGQHTPPDVFRISVANNGDVPDSSVARGPDEILQEAFGPYKAALSKNWEEGFAKLMTVDELSTREYIRTKTQYGDYYTIQWLETMSSATGLYDQAFSESVIDSFDFDTPGGEEWVCIEGGTSLVIDGMIQKVKRKPEIKKRVTGIAIDRSKTALPSANMSIQIAHESKPRVYSTVFNTTTLACMQRMDLRRAELHPIHKDAIRCLRYDASSKVAIRFKTPWWITKAGITSGGVASTDYPIRTCVYPSYNLKDGPDNPAVLLCSYTWAQDAQRVGGLVSKDGYGVDEQLLELVLKDLAIMHSKFVTYEELLGSVLDYHGFDWYADPNTSGAFALFGPGQFKNLFPILSRPTADGNLHFVGEATSSHHAWVVGALNSAWRAVFNFLKKYQMEDNPMRKEWTLKIELLFKIWGVVDEVETGVNGTAHLQVMLGRLAPKYQVQV